MISVSLLNRLERSLGWHSNLDPETARTVMATVASSLLTLVVLVTSAMLLAVQLASAQLTPRIIALVYRNNFLHLAVTEIRQYGRDSIQVMRRLRAMLESLIETLPARRTPLLRRELELLQQSSKRAFPDMDDQVLADVGDLQGMGGVQEEIFSPRSPAMPTR